MRVDQKMNAESNEVAKRECNVEERVYDSILSDSNKHGAQVRTAFQTIINRHYLMRIQRKEKEKERGTEKETETENEK